MRPTRGCDRSSEQDSLSILDEFLQHKHQNYTLWGIAFAHVCDYGESQEESLVGVTGWGWFWVIQ